MTQTDHFPEKNIQPDMIAHQSIHANDNEEEQQETEQSRIDHSVSIGGKRKRPINLYSFCAHIDKDQILTRKCFFQRSLLACSPLTMPLKIA